jgi:Cys-tRNA(Pro)/Cys-tRNA(Cys) deacylase
MAATPALVALQRAGVSFTVHEYQAAEGADATYGEAVASALGVDPARVLKTLVTVVDDRPMVAIVPVACQLSLKALCRAVGGRRAELASPTDAQRWTGFVIGGISPFGQKRRLPTVVDVSAMAFRAVYVSGGRRGIQVEVAPDDLVSVAGAQVAELTG